MSEFKNIIAQDVHGIFLNTDEFSDFHVINGVEMKAQVDSNEALEREGKKGQNLDGVYVSQKLIYVAASDYGALPKQGSLVRMDGSTYRVTDAVDEDGVYSITLEATRA